jgi:hypothetical protein
MRRSLVVLIAIAAVGAIAAPTASAVPPPCKPPAGLTWHSCLAAAHREVTGTHNFVQVTKATAELVVRMTACPADVPSRRVVVRTEKRKRIVKKRVQGTCKNNIARWVLEAKPKNKVIKGGTVIHSYWSGIDDGDNAPSVKVGKK